MSQTLPADYPENQTWLYDIGVAQVEHELRPNRLLHHKILSGPHAGQEETVLVDIVTVRPGVFMVSWQESNGITVVHIEDYENLRFHSRATLPGGRLMRSSGPMLRLR